MKLLGILLIAAGLALGVYAYQMDTTITTEGKSFGYGIEIPAMTVNNIGLMEDRRNKLMIAGVLIIVGAIFTAFGGVKSKKEKSADASGIGLVKCNYCAEMIKAEAIVCRFCGKDVLTPKKIVHDISKPFNLVFDSKNNIKCPLCDMTLKLDAKELQENHFKCPGCKAEIKFVIVTASELMEKHAITKKGSEFIYDNYHYDTLEEALDFAKLREYTKS